MHARRLDRTRTDASRRRRVAFFVLPLAEDAEATADSPDAERPDAERPDAPLPDPAQTTLAL